MNRRDFLKVIGYSAANLAAGCPTSISPSQKRSLKVLLIGIDGLRPDALQEAATPNINALIEDGAYSFAARTGEHTLTGPGWSNIFTGVWEPKHGVIDNSFKGANYKEYPTLFSRIENYRPELNTEAVASLDWITKFISTKADHSRYHPFKKDGDRKVAETAAYLLKHRNIDFVFAYFMGVDEIGHNYGFDSQVPEYLSEIETMDHYVGMLMEGMKRRPAYNQERWLTILTSDHGGKGKSHGGITDEERNIPLILHGPSTKKGEIIPVPTQVDIAPTVLTYFGVPIRQKWGLDGKVVGLK